MKLEHVTIDDMLRSYLKSNFANRNTLVIWPLSMCDSEAEVETIKQDLFEFGYLPPKSYFRNGFWIIEMPTHTAFEIINCHSKGTLAIEQSCRRAERIPGLRFYRLPRRSKERPAGRAREARTECARYRP